MEKFKDITNEERASIQDTTSYLEAFRGDTDTWTVVPKHLGMVVFPRDRASGPEMLKKV